MNAARQIIADAARQGATFRLADGKLRLVPPPGQQPPADLVPRVKANLTQFMEALIGNPGRILRCEPDCLQREADRRNAKAARDDVIDRSHRCGRLATLAFPKSAGSEFWLCLDCLDANGNE